LIKLRQIFRKKCEPTSINATHYITSSQNNSKFVDVLNNPSDNICMKPCDKAEDNNSTHLNSTEQTFGVFQTYPPGILNPAFTGMFLWDFSRLDNLNEYKSCKHHSIKSGLILYGSEAFVFTPLSNNDMQLYLNILFRGISLQKNLTKSRATRMIIEYIRVNSRKIVIPSIPSI